MLDPAHFKPALILSVLKFFCSGSYKVPTNIAPQIKPHQGRQTKNLYGNRTARWLYRDWNKFVLHLSLTEFCFWPSRSLDCRIASPEVLLDFQTFKRMTFAFFVVFPSSTFVIFLWPLYFAKFHSLQYIRTSKWYNRPIDRLLQENLGMWIWIYVEWGVENLEKASFKIKLPIRKACSESTKPKVVTIFL